MNLKKLIPLTFSAVSLVSIPSIVCSCGNQHQPDYTIRCDTKEITWSLSQTTETNDVILYTKDTYQFATIETNSGFSAYLHKEKDGPSLGKNITPHFGGYNELSFTNLDQTTTIGNYWLRVIGLEYRDILNIFGKNDLWFVFNIIE